MEGLLAEAKELSDAGVKELLVIAQDITRYGTDLNGEHQLSKLIHELCRLDFHWIRLHYLYPDEITEDLIDAIAGEPKVVKYLDIPIQHCNDGILKAMNRRDTKAELLDLLAKLRSRIPGLVLRTSLITGLPGEGGGGAGGAVCLSPGDKDRAGRRVPLLPPEEGHPGGPDGPRGHGGGPPPGGAGGGCPVRHHRRIQRLRPGHGAGGPVRGL